MLILRLEVVQKLGKIKVMEREAAMEPVLIHLEVLAVAVLVVVMLVQLEVLVQLVSVVVIMEGLLCCPPHAGVEISVLMMMVRETVE